MSWFVWSFTYAARRLGVDPLQIRRALAPAQLGCLAYLISLVTACSASSTNPPPGSSASSSTNQQVFQVKGVVKKLQPDGKTVDIRHEAIPDYMPAMTMPFEAKEPKELALLKEGDAISFRMHVTETDVWIDQIRKEESTNAASAQPSSNSFRVVKDVEPLQVGDRLPEYHFTNELGQAVSTTQLKGQAVAITFIFTRCPLPNFCPRMSTNFEEAQKKLLARTQGPTNWQLLTISFDPEFDKPPILKAYAQRYGADPAHWHFLTGDLVEITAISDQFGQRFWRDEGALNHNLRTVVIDASGRVQQILTGNSWNADELVSELVKAAGDQAAPTPK